MKLSGSWRTTTLGILVIVASIIKAAIALLNGETPNVEELLTGILGIGLFISRDNKVTSEEVGAK